MEDIIMNLVSLIAGQVQTKHELFSQEGRIMDSLMSSGYRLHEADAVLSLMQSLARTGGDAGETPQSAAAMRAMSTEERSRFTIGAFSFITKLGTLGIISEEQREEVIEKALSLRGRRIELEEVKSLVAVHLLADAREYDDIIATVLDRNGAAWN